jgi:hypothetical protein
VPFIYVRAYLPFGWFFNFEMIMKKREKKTTKEMFMNVATQINSPIDVCWKKYEICR